MFSPSFGKHVEASSSINIKVYGEGCGQCYDEYVDELTSALSEVGILDVESVYLDSEISVEELEAFRRTMSEPQEMRQYVAVRIGDQFLFEGYMPVIIIVDFVTNHTDEYSSLVVSYDNLRRVYTILESNGNLVQCETQKSISECVEPSIRSTAYTSLTLVLVSGLMDGINPCAFSVLLFFAALIYGAGTMTDNPRSFLLGIGSLYIVGVYASYLLIGLFLYQTISNFPDASLVAELGAYLLILLGVINIKDFFYPGLGISLRLPEKGLESIRNWMRKLTLPSSFIAGLLVGFFEFPCTGGVYLAIIGLLAVNSSYLEGFFYLALYNLAFIAPLCLLLILSISRQVENFSFTAWNHDGNRKLKLVSGFFFIVIGMLISYFN